MARSLKKGPFVDDHLMKKVEAMNAAGERKVIAPCRPEGWTLAAMQAAYLSPRPTWLGK